MTFFSRSCDKTVSHLAFFAALLAASTAPAFAQESAPDDEIVVTATRAPTRLDRIPARVDAITREEMEQRNDITIVEALSRTPGLNVVQSGGAGTLTSVFSRGTNSKHTLALFDGIRLNDASAPNGQYNFGQDTVGGLERIEVLRGAASSIYGSDAIGGVINFIPRIGGNDAFDPFFEVSAGSHSSYRASVGAAGTTGAISYGVTGEHFTTDGFNNTPDRFPDTLGEEDGSSFNALNVVADLRLGDVATLRGLVRWRDAETDIDDAALDRLTHRVEDEYLVWRLGPRFLLLNDTLEIDIHGGQVLNERADIDPGDVNNAFPFGDTTAEGERSFANWRNTLSLGEAAGFSDVVLSGGVEWQDEDIDVQSPFSDPLSRSEQATGYYGLARGTVGGNIDLSASLRHDDTDAAGDANTWNVGVVLRFPELATRLYGSVGTSFKAPTLSERFSTSAFNVGNPDLQPEEGESWEIGVDVDPLDTVRVGATYFESDITNLIEYNFGELRNVNVGKATIDGYEAFVEWAPLDVLSARVNYTYTDAINANANTRLLRRPPHVWGASLEFTPNERLTLTADYFSRGDQWDVRYGLDNPFGPGGGFLGSGPGEDAFSTVNLAGRFKLSDDLSVFASVRNALDEEYENPEAFRGPPQAISVGLRGQF